MDLEARFEQFENDYIKFEKMENKLHSRPDICAFLLLDRLVPGNRDIVSAAEHDEIYLDVDCELLAAAASDEDIRTLVRCGVRYDSDVESLAMFV